MPKQFFLSHKGSHENFSFNQQQRLKSAIACRGNKWAEENCKAVGNWPKKSNN